MKMVTFPGRYDSLAKISEFVIQAAKDAGLDSKAVYAVELSVDEACCNIIDHAYGGEDIGDMQCSVQIQPGQLTVILRDQGEPYNPDDVPELKMNVPLEDLKLGGAGVFLIKNLMDEVHYRSEPGSENVLTLVKRQPSSSI
jgi:serine/threonine-protein kinase RsbW